MLGSLKISVAGFDYVLLSDLYIMIIVVLSEVFTLESVWVSETDLNFNESPAKLSGIILYESVALQNHDFLSLRGF